MVANAIKLTPTGGAVDVVFNLNTENDEPVLKVIVEDNFRGMMIEQIEAPNNGKRLMKKSFGMGLAHTYNLVEKQNGHIMTERNNNRGTIFSVALPLPACLEF